ncbi:nitronate monooxygenase [Burkholderiaceae bacterium]|nr:nitronate monooxygenase [Burkholderiaceae bacterium]
MRGTHALPQRVCDALGIRFPLLLAGMGGIAGPELVAAVSNAGGAGTLGLYKMPVERIAAVLEETQALTAAPFGANFVPEVLDDAELLQRVDAVMACSRDSVFLSFFGLPPAAVAAAVRRAGRRLVVQVGSAGEAQAAVQLGAHVLVLQGTEAGGHLLGELTTHALLERTRALLPRAAIAVAGGVATGGDFARLGAAGADGVCCGTLFVATCESRAHPHYKQAVVSAGAGDTEITGLFDIGWPLRRHRVIRTPRVAAGRSEPAAFIARTQVYGRPCAITRYSAAVPTIETSGAVEEMALYCGTSCGRIADAHRPAGAVVAAFADDYAAASLH